MENFPGLSKEYVESLPIWDREGRTPTIQEFQDWSRSHPRACREYIPAWPIGYYHGKCLYFVKYGKPCGLSFVQRINCLTGVPEDSRRSHVGWKDFRRTRDRLGRSDEQIKRKLQELSQTPVQSQARKKRRVVTQASAPVPRTPRGSILYNCEVCNEIFESQRARSGPKLCAKCIGELRKKGLGPIQQKRGNECENTS